ncbi:MAG: DUF4159 domain-containing protein [Tepidisphaeraceae bacterium]
MVFATLVLFVADSIHASDFAEVDQAIEHAKAYLYSKQEDGNWEMSSEQKPNPSLAKSPEGGQWTGQTALVVYALLAAGENPHDPRIERAIEFLKKEESTGVYAAAMRAQVWLLLPRTNETRAMMRKEVGTLESCFHQNGQFKGLYDYTRAKTLYSLSRSQYGVLGMWAAAQMGENIKLNYWRLVENAWTGIQKPDGGWKYLEIPQFPSTPGITAVGVATLFITQDYLHADKGANCVGNVASPAIERGLQWIIDHFDRVATDERYDYDLPFPTLYSIERIGAASGLKHFGAIDWYEKGADWLVRSQQDDGSWSADERDIIPQISDTSFAVLFLSRGRSPLVMSKLQYTNGDGTEPGAWNQRPRDVANITRFAAQAAERELNWQIVNINGPIDDFFDAPILYVSGKNVWQPTSGQIAKLRNYLEDGGMLLANADCGGAGFAKGVQELGKSMFPGYTFRELPDDHPVYTEQQFPRQRWKVKHSVLGLSNGVRELIVLIPSGDAGRAWQLNSPRGREESWQLGADLFQYAVDKRNLRLRGQSYRVARDESVHAEKVIKVARIQYAGNWDPEPGGWRRLANVMPNKAQIGIAVRPIALGAGALSTDAFSIAHLTGTEEVMLPEADIKELKSFIEAGGTLVIDSAGGSSAFATSAELLLTTLFPDQKPKRLAVSHPLYSPRSDTTAQPMFEVAYRPYARARLGVADSTPRVQAIEQDGRIVAFYSREDLSAGMVGQPIDGIIGYEPASATGIMSRILQFVATE